MIKDYEKKKVFLGILCTLNFMKKGRGHNISYMFMPVNVIYILKSFISLFLYFILV